MEQCNNEDHEVGSLSDESAIKTKDQIEPLADVESKSDVGCHNAAPGNQPYTAAKTCRINGADVVKEINSSTSSPSEVGAFLVSSAAACSTKEQLSAKVQLVEEPKAPSLETLMAVDEPILNSKKLISNCQDSTADISTGNPERIVSREVGSFPVSGTVTSKEYLASNTPELATSLSPQVSEELRSVSTLRQQTSLGKKEFSSTFNEANLRKPSAFVVPPSDPFGNVDSSSSPADDKPLSLGMRVVSSTLNQENLQTTSVFDAPPLYTCGSADSSTSLGKREFSSTFNQANLRTPSAFVVPPSDPFGSAIASFSSVDDHVVELQELSNADLGNEPIGNCSDSCNNIQGEPVHAFLAENYGEFPLAVGSPSSFEFPQETSLALFPLYRRKIIRCSEGNSVLKYSSHETNKQKSVVVCDGACVFRQRLCLGLFITLTVVGVILSLAIPLSRRADSQHYYNDLKAIIIDNSISSSSSINTKGSPQNDALNWLAFKDAANIPVSLQSWVIQRYITAVLYYSLNGQSWENQYNFLSGDHECRWNGYWNEIYLSAEGITCDSYGNAIFVVLARNGLSGKLPVQEISCLSRLRKLNLESNTGITGTLGVELGNLTDLEDLVLDFNQISGSIPTTVGKLKNLMTLDLRGNRLSSSLPISMGSLENLRNLSVADNMLIGTIPAAYANLSSLQEFWLYSNSLTGSVSFLCESTNVTKISADCGTISCTCKNICDCF